MTTQWKSLLDKLEAYTESSAPVDWTQEIKSIATICAEQHKPLKAAISQLRGLLAKHQRDIEKQSGKMLSNALGNLAEGPELSAKNPAINYLLTNVHAGTDIGVGTDVAKWNDESAPVVVSAGEFVAEVTKHDAYKPYMKWFDEKAEEKKQDKLVAAADIALSKAVLTTACANIGDAMVLREKKVVRQARAASVGAVFIRNPALHVRRQRQLHQRVAPRPCRGPRRDDQAHAHRRRHAQLWHELRRAVAGAQERLGLRLVGDVEGLPVQLRLCLGARQPLPHPERLLGIALRA